MAKKRNRRFLKLFFGLLVILAIAYFVTPEVEIKQARKDSVAYIAKETGYSPAVCNWLVGTKVGRKLCYIGLKREMKYYLRQAKKEMRKIEKELN